MSSQLHLPGSNNASTAGRAIDTYDRGFDGADGTRDPVNASVEERRLAAQGLLTDTGYHCDDFVVEDTDPTILGGIAAQLATQPIDYGTRERTQGLVIEAECDENDSGSDYDPADSSDEDDSDDDNSDYDGSQPDSVS